jgi:hypothetical protein
MRKFIKVLGLAACLSTVGVAASFADQDGQGQNGQGQNGQGQNGQGQNGRGAPAPEIGATVLGLLGAAGLASYIRARRRKIARPDGRSNSPL